VDSCFLGKPQGSPSTSPSETHTRLFREPAVIAVFEQVSSLDQELRQFQPDAMLNIPSRHLR